MKKRVISFVIVLMLLFQIQPIFAVNSESDAEIYVYKKSEDFLKALSIVPGGEVLTQSVTRGQAALNIAKLLDEDEKFYTYRGIFADVKSDNKNALAIEKLADLGIVRGDGNYCFRPDDYITYSEATTVFMNVLGYGIIGQEKAHTEAVRAGILDNVIAEYDVVCLGDLYVMMYNALFASPIVQTVYGNDQDFQKSEQTLLYKIYDIVYADGVVVKNDLTYLWSDKDAYNSSIMLSTANADIEIFSEDMGILREELGKRIRVYFVNNEELSRCIYVYHEEKASNKIIDIDLEQIDTAKTDFLKRQVSYYKTSDSKVTTIKLPEGYNTIYNNVSYKSNYFDFASVKNKKGTVRFIDADSNGSYETVLIKVFDIFIVENVLLNEGFLTDKYSVGKKLSLDEDLYDKILVYNANKELVGVEGINPGSVVSAAVSDSNLGKKVIEIYVSENVRNGKITKYKKADFGVHIILDGETRFDLYDRALDKTYKTNSNVLVYIDAFGDVVYVADDQERDMQYGLFLGFYKEDGLGGDIRVRYISSAGEFIETKLVEKPIIDGNKPENVVNVLSNLKTTDITFSAGPVVSKDLVPMRYKLTEDGSIKIIDTMKTGSGGTDDCLRLLGRDSAGKYDGSFVALNNNVIGHKVHYVSDATVLDIIIDDFNDIEAYSEEGAVFSKNMANVVSTGRVYNLLMFNSDKDSPSADFIVNFNPIKLTVDSMLFVIDEFMQGYNEDRDEVMNVICGYDTGVYKEFWFDDRATLDGLNSYKRGDIVRLAVDLSDCVINYEEILKRTASETSFKRGIEMDVAAPKGHRALAMICGFVKSRKGDLIETNNFVQNDPVTFGGIETVVWDNVEKYMTNISGIPAVLVDDTLDRIVVASAEDILDYDNFGNKSSFVVIRWRSSSVREIVIYKK